MPIDIDEFDAAEHHREPTTSDRVLRFLGANDGSAFTRREIAEAVDVAPETVGTNLTRLKQRGLVRHREPYWAIAEDREGLHVSVGDLTDDEPRFDRATNDGPADDDAASVHREAATAFFDRVRDTVDDGVDSLYLFGSVVNDATTPDSDVDVLAVVSDDADFATVDDRLLEIAYDVQLDHGVAVEVHSIPASEFTDRSERGEPFVRTVITEGVTGGP